MAGRCFSRSSRFISASTSSPLRYGIMRSSRTSRMSSSRRRTSSASRPSYTRVTRKGPCSSFILMIRPMCGSSSATSACVRGISFTLDEGRDVLAIATQLEEELPDVGLGTDEHEQDGVGIEGGHDRKPVPMLEHGGGQRTAVGGSAELVSRTNDRRNSRREIFCV